MVEPGKPLLPARDNFALPIPCPKCGKQTAESLAWLVANNEFPCSGCGFLIDLKSEKIRSLIQQGEQKFRAIWGRQEP